MRIPTKHEAALQYAGLGWPVFPVHGLNNHVCTCGNAACKNIAKHPMTAEGFKQATTDTAIINRWWTDHTFANIGIRTGGRPEGAGIVVLDVDAQYGGVESLRRLEAEHGKLPETLTVITGGGGYHYLFAHPGVEVGNRQNMLPGLDVRGDGGYIVASPSSHVSGRLYLWMCDHGPDVLEPAPLVVPLGGTDPNTVAEQTPAFPVGAGLPFLLIPLTIKGIEGGPLAGQGEVWIFALQLLNPL